MKKFVAFCLMCVIFCLTFSSHLPVSATSNEQIDFIFNNKIFSYQLEPNIKSSSIFDANYKINKYNRFGSTTERQNLLKYMIEIGIDFSLTSPAICVYKNDEYSFISFFDS
mgnify:CR=1 FL=1